MNDNGIPFWKRLRRLTDGHPDALTLRLAENFLNKQVVTYPDLNKIKA